MRLIIKIIPTSNSSYDSITKHGVQGFVYSLMRDSDYERLHDKKTFKFFCFSDIRPPVDFEIGNEYWLAISSPDKIMIKFLASKIKERDVITINGTQFFHEEKMLNPKLWRLWITGSPVVLYEDNRSGKYFSFRRNKNLFFYLERLKDNAIKKYRIFSGEKDFWFDGPIFDRMIYRKDVAVKMRKAGEEFIIIGSEWKLLHKFRIEPGLRKFYKFLFDAGLGEKNSLGFGFVNKYEVVK